MNNSSVWWILFFLLAIVAWLRIPRKYLIKLLPFGIIGGFLLTLAILLLAVPILGLWAFDTIPAGSLIGVPLSLPLAFVPVMMLFAYYLPKMHRENRVLVWISGFTVLTTLLQGLSVSSGIMRFVRWDLMATLMLSFSGYFLLAAFVLKYGAVPEELE